MRRVDAGGCPVVVAQWQSTGCISQVSWVRFPAAAGLFTFLVFEGSIPTRACFHSENFFLILQYTPMHNWGRLTTGISPIPTSLAIWECSLLTSIWELESQHKLEALPQAVFLAGRFASCTTKEGASLIPSARYRCSTWEFISPSMVTQGGWLQERGF